MTVIQERALSMLTPMWQRIARGEVDLTQYSDDEILSGKIYMADGRRLPKPNVFPDTFIAEQKRRGLLIAERKVRRGAMDALTVYTEILNNDLSEDKDRLKAGEWFLTRFLGKAEQRVHVQVENDEDPREVLLRRLLASRGITQVPPPPEDDVVDAEVVEEPTLEDLL